MNVNDLNEIKEKSFDIWFERWWEKTNLPKLIKQAAMEGYKGYLISFGKDDYLNRRMRDVYFVEKLKENLPGFKINYHEKNMTYKSIFGLEYSEKKEWISINWDDNDEN